MPKSKIIALFSALIFVIVFAAGCGENGSVIARVNGEKILQSELDDKINQIKLGLTSQGYTFGDEEQDKEILGKVEEEALSQLIDEALLMQQANEQGVAVADSKVQEQLQQIKQQYGADVFKQLLTQQQLTEDKLAKQIKVQLTAEALFNKVTKDISVDEKTAKANYEKDPAKYEQIKVAHILVAADSGAGEDKIKAAKEKAQGLIAKLDAGADFAALAKSDSEDQQSAANGGVMDYYFTRDDTSLVKEFVDGAFKVAAGQYSKQPVQTEYGFHIIKVLDKKDNYEELKASLKEQMLSDAKNQAFSEFFNQAKDEAKIENLK
jgi:parvulin-like peptidyl-prolyl isomerase